MAEDRFFVIHLYGSIGETYQKYKRYKDQIEYDKRKIIRSYGPRFVRHFQVFDSAIRNRYERYPEIIEHPNLEIKSDRNYFFVVGRHKAHKRIREVREALSKEFHKSDYVDPYEYSYYLAQIIFGSMYHYIAVHDSIRFLFDQYTFSLLVEVNDTLLDSLAKSLKDLPVGTSRIPQEDMFKIFREFYSQVTIEDMLDMDRILNALYNISEDSYYKWLDGMPFFDKIGLEISEFIPINLENWKEIFPQLNEEYSQYIKPEKTGLF